MPASFRLDDYLYFFTHEEAEAVKKTLRLKCDVECANLTITFNISGKYRPATHWEPEEEPELDVEEIEVNYIASFDGVPITVHTKDRIVVCDNMANDTIEVACWEYAEKLRKESEDDYVGE